MKTRDSDRVWKRRAIAIDACGVIGLVALGSGVALIDAAWSLVVVGGVMVAVAIGASLRC